MAINISVVIPVYKAEDCLHELYRRLINSLEKTGSDFEIIMVEDCGGDRSWEIIKDLSKSDSRITGIKFSRNFGQHYAISAGLDHCKGEWVVVMDCDLQDRPEEIPILYTKALEGYDVVAARRKGRKDKITKKLVSAIFYKAFNYLTDMHHDWEIGNFRIISRKVVDAIGTMNENLRFFCGMVDWMGFRTAAIDVKHDKRFHGSTSYTYKNLWKLASATIIAYSNKPLRIAIKCGAAIALIAFIYGSIIVLRALVYGIPVMGWSSLIVAICFFSGIIILFLGINSIYLGKTFDETKKRPLYLISETSSNKCINIPESEILKYLDKTPWDAQIFGIDTYQIRTVNKECMKIVSKIPGHYTAKVDPLSSKWILHENGFYYCDSLIEPYCPRESLIYFEHEKVSIGTNNSPEEIDREMYDAFLHGRFHRDFNINSHKANLRYVEWMKKLYSSDNVLTLMVNNDLAGIWGISENKILICAIVKKYRGKGYGKYLWSTACREMFKKGYDEIFSSVSATNLAALNLLSSLGFKFRNPVDVYHKLVT
jgi:dolichol-phosphate mannosyltransferase